MATTISVKPGTQSGEAEIFKGKGAPAHRRRRPRRPENQSLLSKPRGISSKDQRNQLETLSRIDEDEEVYPQRAAFAEEVEKGVQG